jgi:glutaconyl-CoA/methylmalonyl-CoA decarboxylase subunit gamma
MKKLRITVEGKTYDVSVEVLGEQAAPQPVPAIAAPNPAPPVAAAASDSPSVPAQSPAAAPAGGDSIVSQLAGTVVSVAVAVGEAVNAGDTLLIIEAMKMNTSIVAPRAGTVATVAVAAGAVIEEGQTLVSLS